MLLIVCANVANLLLSRATAQTEGDQRPPVAWRDARRLIRQLLTESLLLASIGGALGVLVGAMGATSCCRARAGQPAPLDWRVLSFALGVTGATGVLFGIAPAFRRDRRERQRGAEGDESIGGRLAQPS